MGTCLLPQVPEPPPGIPRRLVECSQLGCGCETLCTGPWALRITLKHNQVGIERKNPLDPHLIMLYQCGQAQALPKIRPARKTRIPPPTTCRIEVDHFVPK